MWQWDRLAVAALIFLKTKIYLSSSTTEQQQQQQRRRQQVKWLFRLSAPLIVWVFLDSVRLLLLSTERPKLNALLCFAFRSLWFSLCIVSIPPVPPSPIWVWGILKNLAALRLKCQFWNVTRFQRNFTDFGSVRFLSPNAVGKCTKMLFLVFSLLQSSVFSLLCLLQSSDFSRVYILRAQPRAKGNWNESKS